ncbi:aminoglycoside phosphotransferase family protein [Calidifontibacter sp. DB0510]|uniref:Aminoglycoside phosphotransferase family protein n=1 Tax=Metallococcus carri TaxID=1656884 RepID=A0A967B084_9MICO|nr:aminoglycoside phosphotransferase family protein [Metallococcus carri]NHN55672.1 aminoglycoside phosphotransferase family protein [Metallococcus carri]NOP38144.1 aminoglycoside phosphotransferase family protein [Calidifontibacter sp. DB2511S]
MHDNEERATVEIVRGLIADQFPTYADRPVTLVPQEGTDHVLFRVGEELLARLPKIEGAVGQAEVDAQWMPRLAPHLPCKVPQTVALGRPGEGYPWPWSLVTWIDGDTLGADEGADPAVAEELAAFARALHRIDTTGAPRKQPGERGSHIADLADVGHRAIATLTAFGDNGFDLEAAAHLWQRIVTTPRWDGEPSWVHGDLMPGNLIVRDGHLAGVIDFLRLGVGDPAPDAGAAWWTFTGTARAAYKKALGFDHATLLRGAGWALLPALTGLDYYRERWPAFAESAQGTIRELLADPDLA